MSQEQPEAVETVRNDTEKKPVAKKFQAPTVEEVEVYVKENNFSVDPNRFVSFYESNGCRVGKNPMKNWQAAVRSWEGNDYRKSSCKTVQTHRRRFKSIR